MMGLNKQVQELYTLNPAFSGSKIFEEVRGQLISRADIKEDQKELVWDADTLYFSECEGVILEAWAVARMEPNLARNIL